MKSCGGKRNWSHCLKTNWSLYCACLCTKCAKKKGMADMFISIDFEIFTRFHWNFTRL